MPIAPGNGRMIDGEPLRTGVISIAHMLTPKVTEVARAGQQPAPAPTPVGGQPLSPEPRAQRD